jgi:hypothetical protein
VGGTWHAENDLSEETWADTIFRSGDDGQTLWLHAGDGVTATWLLNKLGMLPSGARAPRSEDAISVSDAVALAPDQALEIMRTTRAVLERYEKAGIAGGEPLAEELADALEELERADVPGDAGGRHPKRGEDVAPPYEYERHHT